MDHNFTTFGDIIYQTCVNNFGAKQHQAKREPKIGRKQCEIQTLQKQKKNLRKQMKSATEEEKNGLQEYWRGLEARHLALKRAKSARKRQSQNKKKKTGTLLQRPISVYKTTLPTKKKKGFAFSTERTAGGT